MKSNVVALCALAVSCGGSNAPGLLASTVDCKSGSATVQGTFVAPNGTTPVVGGQVSVASAAGCAAGTAADGSFKLLNVPSGTAALTARKGSFTATGSATPGTPVKLAIPAAASLAYVPGSFDSIERIVQALGFTPTQIPAANLAQLKPGQYQALFLDCGLDENYTSDAATAAALKGYVQAGGVLYASDWAYGYVDGPFPGHLKFIDPGYPRVGDSGIQNATVVDDALRLTLGKNTASIDFNLPGWVVIQSLPGADLLLSGPAVVNGASKGTLPYSARFSVGSGRVTYTSFHNENQTTPDMIHLLEQMILGL